MKIIIILIEPTLQKNFPNNFYNIFSLFIHPKENRFTNSHTYFECHFSCLVKNDQLNDTN